MSVQMPSPGRHVELFEGYSLPLGGGLDDLGVDGMLVAIVGNVELNRGAGSVAIEHVIDAAFRVDDQRDLNHHQARVPYIDCLRYNASRGKLLFGFLWELGRGW